jgi:hypothetical protein
MYTNTRAIQSKSIIAVKLLDITYTFPMFSTFVHPWHVTRGAHVNTELLGLFWTLSIVLYVEDKRPQRFGDWICLRPQVDGAG